MESQQSQGVQADFSTAFDRAARVYLGPVFFKENDPIPPEGRLDTADLDVK